jgi:hypothetical protein
MKVYCVLEGESYPEGCPDGIFETIEDAKRHIEIRVQNPKSMCIYEYTLNRDGYESVFNYLGEKI